MMTSDIKIPWQLAAPDEAPQPRKRIVMEDDNFRTIPCSHCGGDAGHHDFAGRWSPCTDCDATGEVVICLKPLEMSDLDRMLCGPTAPNGDRDGTT